MKAKILAAVIAINLLALQSSFGQRAVAVPAELEPQIKQFFTTKQAQARALVKLEQQEGTHEIWEFFTAGENGDWSSMADIFPKLQRGARLETIAWRPILECFDAYDHAAKMDEKYVTHLARAILDSIPRGSIYFGGNYAALSLPMAFSKSHSNADPCFVLTQNGLADAFYLKYVRAMYGDRIVIPSDDDSKEIFQEYVADAQKRLAEGKLKPGEDVKLVDGKAQPSGHVALMELNGRLAKKIFDANPRKEFFVAESFPLDWMYPHLTPNGLLMKINREPLNEIPDDVVKKDQTYWTRFINGALDNWLAQTTSVETVCDFARRVFDQKEPAPFQPDEKFVNNADACKSYSKLRSSIAGVYAWRAKQSNSPAEKRRMEQAADFAFRQAFALCPSSPEVVFRYVALLVDQKRFKDARRIAEVAKVLDASGGNYPMLLRELDRLEAQAENKP